MITEKIRTQPCVGCGFCCLTAPCEASRRLYRGTGKCSFLLWVEDESRYKCELMMFAGPLGEAYRKELHAGAGCSSTLFNAWRTDVKKRDSIDINDRWKPLDSIFQVFIKSLSQNFVSRDVISLTLSMMEPELKRRKYTEREIKHINSEIVHMFTQNRRTFDEQFIG
jgi:hypothetical protein